MSSSDKADVVAAGQIEARIDELAALVAAALKDETTADIGDRAVQTLVTLGVRLFARKVEAEERFFPPLREDDMVTATEVVTIIPEMLRAADLSAFDLALWLQRPR